MLNALDRCIEFVCTVAEDHFAVTASLTIIVIAILAGATA